MTIIALPQHFPTLQICARIAARLKTREIGQDIIPALPISAVMQNASDTQLDAIRAEYNGKTLWTSYDRTGVYVFMDADAVKGLLQSRRDDFGWLGEAQSDAVNIKRIFDWLRCPRNEEAKAAPALWAALTGRSETERQAMLRISKPGPGCQPSSN